jgi:hypothetical protein
VTKDERLDRHIEACLVVWLERIRREFYLPHNRQQPKYEHRPFSALKTGDWVYRSPGSPLAVVAANGFLYAGSQKYTAKPDTPLLVKVGTIEAPPCECEPCTIYRTCFPDKVA